MLAGAVVFCRAILANASKIDWPLCAGAGAAPGGLLPNDASRLGGGLPGGVVDVSGCDV